MRAARIVPLLLASVILLNPARSGGQLEDLVLVRFESDPGGARVLLDGAPVCGTEDGCTRLLPGGRYKVRMELDHYRQKEELIDLADGQVVHWVLQPNFGWLTVKTEPPGLPVFLGEEPLGPSPIIERRVDAGTHRVEVRGECFTARSGSVKVRRGAGTEIRLRPRRSTRALHVRAVDEDGPSVKAQVLVDGARVGKTPGRFRVDACATRLEVKASGRLWMGPLKLSEGDAVTELEVTLAGGSRVGEMAFVPAGWFMMGCNEAADQGCDEDERPYHRVWLDSFYVDVSEVTVAMYRDCVEAGACTPPAPGAACNWGEEGREAHPANCTDWFQAGAYCAWAGKQLPTEAQWEKAARGIDGRIWPWGNEPPTCARCAMGEGGPGCGTGGTLPVCSKPEGRSPYGACDMAGNVMEWVEDPQDPEFYARSPERNPVNPGGAKDRLHCLRGGERAYTIVNFLRTSNRDGLQPEYSNYGIGFRCTRWAK